jgi:hypothetical protein
MKEELKEGKRGRGKDGRHKEGDLEGGRDGKKDLAFIRQ